MSEITLEFTIEEVNVILAGLGQVPYVTAAPLIEKLHKQAGPQVEAIQMEQQAAPQVTIEE